MAARGERIREAIARLASLYEYGALMADTTPEVLLNQACDEIERLRTTTTPTKGDDRG